MRRQHILWAMLRGIVVLLYLFILVPIVITRQRVVQRGESVEIPTDRLLAALVGRRGGGALAATIGFQH